MYKKLKVKKEKMFPRTAVGFVRAYTRARQRRRHSSWKKNVETKKEKTIARTRRSISP